MAGGDETNKMTTGEVSVGNEKKSIDGDDTMNPQQRPPREQPQPRPQPQPSSSSPSSDVIRSLSLLDPMIQFLTRATGQTVVPLSNLQSSFPGGISRLSQLVPSDDMFRLIELGILQIEASRPSSSEPASSNVDATQAMDEETNDWKIAFVRQWTDPRSIISNGDDDDAGSDPTESSTRMWTFKIGFPSGEVDKKLCGSTKTAAKRRMVVLKQRLKQKQQQQQQTNKQDSGKTARGNSSSNDDGNQDDKPPPNSGKQQNVGKKNWTLPQDMSNDVDGETAEENSKEPELLESEKEAHEALSKLLGLEQHQKETKQTTERSPSTTNNFSLPSSSSSSSSVASKIPTSILPRQVSYAGSHPAQNVDFDRNEIVSSFHPSIRTAFLNHGTAVDQKLYTHQASAINSALDDEHTIVCTGTGSGKSLCFWIPVLQRAIVDGKKSLLIFPTKALAQDQLIKLQGILQRQEGQELSRQDTSDDDQDEPFLLKDHIYAATLDGDTPHSQRSLVCSTCNIILTNPDTLHCSILPNWNKQKYYKELLNEMKYVVIDEAHMYEGVFGAHVAMILARLYRVHSCCQFENLLANDDIESSSTPPSDINQNSSLVFLACSATLPHPEHHFRLLCCIPSNQPITVVTKDASPRGAKHFFVWNPPLLDEHGKSLGFVKWPKKTKKKGKLNKDQFSTAARITNIGKRKISGEYDGPIELSKATQEDEERKNNLRRKDVRRRHSAEETALLLARAVTMGVRCIAFCKTRCLVEWVYDRCIKVLKQSPKTEMLASLVDSYRGGYTKIKRREIEEKLFRNQLLGVVGTSALELGVDIGGVNLTLHCGFPSSHASLMQQAGRAGRGAAASSRASLAICICFNSPVDQHLHRHPSSLLSRGTSAQLSMPIYPGLVQGHLLCAGNEFPLAGDLTPSAIQSVERSPDNSLLTDHDLFGGGEVYEEALESLILQGSMVKEDVAAHRKKATVYKTHPSNKNAWSKVSIRSIENVNYDIVDITHPRQAGRTDGTHDEAAVLDNIPYSRVFYHAFRKWLYDYCSLHLYSLQLANGLISFYFFFFSIYRSGNQSDHNSRCNHCSSRANL
mmetsp:Transcript_13924/g.33366  ORF Transcript_13924/g.33366 Transcript_13924/m.33366 type:complete len:1080 (+) Transcript_13924:218-3457(+)